MSGHGMWNGNVTGPSYSSTHTTAVVQLYNFGQRGGRTYFLGTSKVCTKFSTRGIHGRIQPALGRVPGYGGRVYTHSNMCLHLDLLVERPSLRSEDRND